MLDKVPQNAIVYKDMKFQESIYALLNARVPYVIVVVRKVYACNIPDFPVYDDTVSYNAQLTAE